MSQEEPKYQIESPCTDEVFEGNTMVAILEEARIFSIEKQAAGFRITEACDGFFYLAVSHSQLRDLATELLNLAGGEDV